MGALLQEVPLPWSKGLGFQSCWKVYTLLLSYEEGHMFLCFHQVGSWTAPSQAPHQMKDPFPVHHSLPVTDVSAPQCNGGSLRLGLGARGACWFIPGAHLARTGWTGPSVGRCAGPVSAIYRCLLECHFFGALFGVEGIHGWPNAAPGCEGAGSELWQYFTWSETGAKYVGFLLDTQTSILSPTVPDRTLKYESMLTFK